MQFEVLADRIASEFDLPCHFEATSFEVVRWVDADDPKQIKKFADANRDNIARTLHQLGSDRVPHSGDRPEANAHQGRGFAVIPAVIARCCAAPRGHSRA